MKKIVQLGDGSSLEVSLTGQTSGKTIMLPVAKKSVYGQEAEALKLWGVDPELGTHFIDGLSDTFQVLSFDYEGHLLQHPRPDTLTPDHIVIDLLRIADAMNVARFSYYGYSWLALVGLQLAIRTDRLESLIMGGFPPYEGPYKEMMMVTDKTYELAMDNMNIAADYKQDAPADPDQIDWDNVRVQINPDQTKQFVTMYASLMDFDDKAVQALVTIPRLVFAGEQDTIVYGDNFGGVTVDIIGFVQKHKDVLEQLGWDVVVLAGDDMNHTKAMQPATVLPIIKPWLVDRLLL